MDVDFKKIYIDWLNENIYQNKIDNNLYRITFPYLDRNNDHIEIYIKAQGNDNFYLTDDSETLNELDLSGMDIFSSERRIAILNMILNSHGVKMDSNHALYVESQKATLPIKKHLLTQCMIKISDMFYLARPNTKSLFIEDVKGFLDKNDIYCFPNISFSGKSGLVTTYDFGIQPSKKAPERLIKVVNQLDVQKAGYITFLWGDTKEVRPSDSSLYVFIQDTGKKISQPAINTMKQYEIKPVLWSKRENFINDLIA